MFIAKLQSLFVIREDALSAENEWNLLSERACRDAYAGRCLMPKNILQKDNEIDANIYQRRGREFDLFSLQISFVWFTSFPITFSTRMEFTIFRSIFKFKSQ